MGIHVGGRGEGPRRGGSTYPYESLVIAGDTGPARLVIEAPSGEHMEAGIGEFGQNTAAEGWQFYGNLDLRFG